MNTGMMAPNATMTMQWQMTTHDAMSSTKDSPQRTHCHSTKAPPPMSVSTITDTGKKKIAVMP